MRPLLRTDVDEQLSREARNEVGAAVGEGILREVNSSGDGP